MSTCKHKELFPIARGSLWAKWDWFCKDCGVCPADASVPSRVEDARRVREEEARFASHQARLDAMSPEERTAYDKELAEGIAERLKGLEAKLRPFQNNCYRPYGYF